MKRNLSALLPAVLFAALMPWNQAPSPDAPLAEQLKALYKVTKFSPVAKGFAVLTPGTVLHGLQKVAVFADSDGPTHMSCQTHTGLWVSKLGSSYEILHELHDIEGDTFGAPALILARNIGDGAEQLSARYSAVPENPGRY